MIKKLPKNRQKYEKPSIQLFSLQNTSPYEGVKYSDALAQEIDGINIVEILKNYGSPVFILSEKKLRENFKDFDNAFHSLYENTTLSYSYKTNYLSTICAILKEEGAWAEVVSGMEYEMAEKLGMPRNHIIFNGCYKKPDELLKAVINDSVINIDSADEALQLEKIALKLRKKIKVGMRINMRLSTMPWNKFGFNLESGQAYEMCKRLYSSKLIEIKGLHAHIGTYVFDPALYSFATSSLIKFAMTLEEQFGFKIEYFDLGGGYPSANTLQQQFLPASYIVPNIKEYAKSICIPLKEFKSRHNITPQLFLEPGRALVDDAVSCLTTVVAHKTIAQGVQGIIIDAGINILPTANWYDHDITCISKGAMSRQDTVIFGPLCMQIDVVRKYIKLPPLQHGDILMIKNTGAYNMTQSMQFIYTRPAIILVNNGKAEIIKKAETIDDIQHLEELPERFRLLLNAESKKKAA